MKKNYFLFILFLANFLAFSQVINPDHIINLCSNQDIEGTTPTTNQYNNLSTNCSFQSLSTAITFYYVEIESGTTFTFLVSPDQPVDFDFASWKNPNLQNLGIADRGSQNTIVGINTYDIGLSLDEPTQVCEGAGAAPPFTGIAPGLVRYYDVQPGDGILIAIDHWESSVIGYNLSFGGDAVLNCSIVEKNLEVCDNDKDGKESFDLNEIKNSINNVNNSFTIDFFENINDANNVNATNFLPSPYTVTLQDSPKIIYARFKRNNGLLARVSPITLIVNEVANIPKAPLLLLICDEENNTSNNFNLTDIEAQINAVNTSVIDYKYFENEQDALTNSANTIQTPSNYSSTSKTIYINVSINDKCPVIVPLKLIKDKINITSKNIEYSEFCATTNENGLIYDLSKTFNYLIENKNINDYTFSTHNSLYEATTKSNSITTISNYLLAYNQDKTLYIRIENKNGCFTISEIKLKSRKRITLPDQYNKLCEPYILKNLPAGYNYYTQPNGEGEIIDPNTNDVVYGKRTIYIFGNGVTSSKSNQDFNKCTYETVFTIYNNDCSLPKGISPNGDGLNDFLDLTPFNAFYLKVFNRHGVLMYEFENHYTNQWNGLSKDGNILPTGVYFYTFQTIYGPKSSWLQITREVK